MKIRQVRDFETMAVSFRRACDISRACRPICGSPISPSSSAFGTSAATESTTTTSTPPERIRVRSEEHTSELQSPCNLVCRLLLEKKKKNKYTRTHNTIQ